MTPKVPLAFALLLASSACAETVPPTPPLVGIPVAPAAAPESPVSHTEPSPGSRSVPPMTHSGATLTWYGHAAFKLVTASGKVLWFDPWITNPKNPTGKDDLAKIDKADLILVSHGHFDHVGDAVAIAKKTHAKLVTTFDLGRAIVEYDGYPREGAGFDSQGNVGGDVVFWDGEVRVSFVPAIHSSTVSRDDAKGNNVGDLRPGGAPGGFVVSVKNGPVVYHTGDTDLFADMALIAEFHKVNVMLACIGDHFTMGPDRAAEAVRLVGPSMVVPMHYGTMPILTGTPEAFEAAVKRRGLLTEVKAMAVHETLAL